MVRPEQPDRKIIKHEMDLTLEGIHGLLLIAVVFVEPITQPIIRNLIRHLVEHTNEDPEQICLQIEEALLHIKKLGEFAHDQIKKGTENNHE